MVGTTIAFEKKNGILVPVNAAVSSYQPPQGVGELTRNVKTDYQTGLDILSKPFLEFDEKSVIDEMNVNQRAFLLHSDIEFTRDDEKWRWDRVRPVVRNKVLSMAAHLTAQILVPNVFAQNPDDMEDKQMGEIMRLLLEWNVRNSDYDITFLYGVIAGLVNPAAYFGVDYIEATQTIKEKVKGKYQLKEVVDEFMSGLKVTNVPLDEVFITNPYEYHLQKQRAIGRRKFPEYSELKKIYGNHPNWKYVQPGIKTVFNEEDNTFYDQRDENLNTLAEHFVYYNREEDLEVPFVNGIYMGEDTENPVEGNPIRHRDQNNKPLYNLVKFGAEPIDEKKFYFFKSIASKLMNDYDLANRTWRIAVDTATLRMKPPVGVAGESKLTTDIYYPGSIANVSKDTQFTQLPVGDENAGYNLITLADNQMSESSQDPFRQGLSKDLPNTAFQQAQLTQNARIQLGLIGKMILGAVKELGSLMLDDIMHHQTVAEVNELAADKLQFKNFLFPNQIEEGRQITKEIRFDGSLMRMKEDELEKVEAELLEEEGGLEGSRRIYKVNPRMFRRMKYMIYIDADALLPTNEAFEQAMKLDAYAKAITNPLIASDMDAMTNVTRDLLLGAMKVTRGKEEKYLPRQKPQMLPQMSQPTNSISAQARESQEKSSLSELKKVAIGS